jgi:hypothetical protein
MQGIDIKNKNRRKGPKTEPFQTTLVKPSLKV